MLYFIVNEKSKSGNAKQIWKEIEEVLKVRNVSYQAFVSEYRGHAGKLAAEICAMDDNDICLVAVGGDGTANEVINGITDFEKVRFGVIPTGSGNDLARGLSLSKDPKNGAIHILNAMKKSREDTWCMDLGEVNFGEKKRLFAISAGIGLDALVCKKALKSTIKDILNKIRLGKLTYLVLTVQSLFTMQTADAEIEKIIGEIRKEIREHSAEMKLPFPLTVSAGCVHTDMTTGCDLDDYVREADAIMYEEKTAKKANRT